MHGQPHSPSLPRRKNERAVGKRNAIAGLGLALIDLPDLPLPDALASTV